MNKFVYANSERCVRCHGCEVACQREHEGQSHMHVVLVADRSAVPMNCRHCTPAPCVVSCPTDALSVVGAEVQLDPSKCTGCTLCMFACPFGVIAFSMQDKVATKCDLCKQRRAVGREPACVTTCPCEALIYAENESRIQSAQKQEISIPPVINPPYSNF